MREKTLWLMVVSAILATPAGPQKSDDPKTKLGAFQGSWKSEATFADGRKASADLVCRWSPQGNYLVCEQLVQLPDREQRQLTVYAYNSSAGTYHYATFSDPGAKPSDGTIDIQASVWTYNSSFQNNGKTTQVRNTNEFTDPDTEIFKIVTSDDGGATWKTLLQGKGHRVSEAAAPRPATGPDKAAEKMSALLGQWQSESTSVPNGSFPGGKNTTGKECRWAPLGHSYVICELIVATPVGNHRQLTIYAYNRQDGAYSVSAIVEPGARATGPGKLTIEGSGWIVTYKYEIAARTRHVRSTTEYFSPTLARTKVEFSDDGGDHWKTLATGTEHKVGD